MEIDGRPDHEIAILEKIKSARQISKSLDDFAKTNLKAFSGLITDEDVEWSNKIYLISQQTLATFIVIEDAIDESWKIKVAIRELAKWLELTHQVLNKFEIEDDWDQIGDLVTQETNLVEWKSTFFTPTEVKQKPGEEGRALEREMLKKITKAMLGMMNSDGGTILVGLVENPQKIVRDDIKDQLIFKNNIAFLDVDHELEIKNRNLDEVKRMMQDYLSRDTKLSVEEFNNLWTIEPISIKVEGNEAIIYKITIHKSDKLIFNIDGENKIALLKRADGRTIAVDPRKYIN